MLLSTGFAKSNEATLYLSATSISIRPAQWLQGGKTNSLTFSAFDTGRINDELAFSTGENDPASHFAYVYIQQKGLSQMAVGELYLGAPGLGDVNGNGLTDFCEIGRGNNNVSTTGVVAIFDDAGEHDGSVEAVWNRVAGMTTGTISLHLQVSDLGIDLGTTNVFEIYQYLGTLSYTPTTTGVLATVQVDRLGGNGSLRGPFPLVRTDIFDLDYPAGTWTNSDNARLNFISSTDLGVNLAKGALPTYYNGLIDFAEGMPALGPDSGYETWYLDLFDLNDANHNKIPDLAEPPIDLAPPSLALALGPTNLNLFLGAHLGQTVYIDLSPTLERKNWSTLLTIPVTNAIQRLALPFPKTERAFFRARL